MVSLQQHVSSMEETVRSLLQNPDSLEGSNIDPLDLMKAYKDKLLEEMWKQQDSLEGPPASPAPSAPQAKGSSPRAERPVSPGASDGPEEESDLTKPLLERLKALEAENSVLTMENDNQRKQYERCLDEVANQVVQALLTQKDLKEECVKLRTRVFDLEQQNRILNVLFQQRVKTSSNPVSQEGQRNGKAGVPAGRWPSLLSLTCPRSSGSGSGSEASLSSACSEYSSGSHTWAEGRGSSRQSALSREKRMSAGSVSGHQSTPPAPAAEQPDLGWKEGHILKGLRRLQMRSPKDHSSVAATSHYKDCMTSNEGIYSLGLKSDPQGVLMVPKLAVGKAFTPGSGVTTLISDSDDADDDSPQSQARESGDQPTKDTLSVEGGCSFELVMSHVDYKSQEQPVKGERSPSNFLSPVKDNVLSEGPENPAHTHAGERGHTHTGKPESTDCLERDKPSAFRQWNDRDTTQKSADRKSRLDSLRHLPDRGTGRQLEPGTREVNLPLQHTAARALSWACEARQRSSSMDTSHYRDPHLPASSQGGARAGAGAGAEPTSTKDYPLLEEAPPRRRAKPLACDSARRAFILRSRSADGGPAPGTGPGPEPDQAKQLHSPLHQKLIKGNHRVKARSNTSPNPGHSIANPKSNINKVSAAAKGLVGPHMAEKGPPESAGPGFPSSPVKQSKQAFKPPGLNDASRSPSKSSQPASKLPSRNDSGAKGPPTSNPNSPLKQRQPGDPQQHSDGPSHPHSDLRSPSPPPPPGRTISLLVRPGYDPSSQAPKTAVQPQTSVTVKMTSTATTNTNISKPQPTSGLQPQVHSKTQDNRPHMAPKMGAEVKMSPKRAPAKVYHPFSSPVLEAKETDSSQSSKNRPGAPQPSHKENSVPFMVQNQNHGSGPVAQQSVGETQTTDLPPQTSACLLHGVINNHHHSVSRVVKTCLPVGSKPTDTTLIQGNSFVALARGQDKGESNTATKAVQTFETFNHETYTRQMMHGVSAAVAKAKARRKIEMRCSSLDSEPPVVPPVVDSGMTLDWGFDEEGWLFKRSVSVSTRPPLKPVMGMNGAKARSQSFGARYMDRPNFGGSGKVRTQIKTHSGSSLNSLGDIFQGSMSCSSSYHCPMNRSLVNNFMIEEGLPLPTHPGASGERYSLKHLREAAKTASSLHLQAETQSSGSFCEVREEVERQNSSITTIEEKVMMGIEENLQKTQVQERTLETKQKTGPSLANWFGFRKSKLPAPSGKKGESHHPKGKEEKKEPKIGSLLGGKQAKDKKKERRKSDSHGKDSSAGRRSSHDAVLLCISMPSPGGPISSQIQGHSHVSGEVKRMYRRSEGENGAAQKSLNQDHVIVCTPGSGCTMRTLDSGIGTFHLPASSSSSSFFSSIFHLLPKSTSAPDRSLPLSSPFSPLSPVSLPSSSKDHMSPSPLPRWRVPSGAVTDRPLSHSSDTTVTLVQSEPYSPVAFFQPVQSLCDPVVTCASVCDTHSRLPRRSSGGLEPKRLSHIKTKTGPSQNQQKDQSRLQLAN